MRGVSGVRRTAATAASDPSDPSDPSDQPPRPGRFFGLEAPSLDPGGYARPRREPVESGEQALSNRASRDPWAAAGALSDRSDGSDGSDGGGRQSEAVRTAAARPDSSFIWDVPIAGTALYAATRRPKSWMSGFPRRNRRVDRAGDLELRAECHRRECRRRVRRR